MVNSQLPEAQILANRRNAQKSTGSQYKRFLRFALSLCFFVPQCLCGYESFMQNKPNFQNSEMNTTLYITKDYENKRLFRRGKNKAKTNPNKANLLRNQVCACFVIIKSYETNLDFWLKNPKADFRNDKMNINYVKTKDYEDLRLFRRDENKAKTNPSKTQL